MKKLVFILMVLVVVAFGVTSCINTDVTGNKEITAEVPSVANFNTSLGRITLLSPNRGEVIVPQETASTLNPGDCVVAQFTIDYDNQPNDKYCTASVVNYKEVRRSMSYVRNLIDPEEYTSPIEGLLWYIYSPILQGNYFLKIYCKGIENTTDYQLLAGRDSVDVDTGVYDLYLLSKIKNTSGSLVGDNHAFDMNPILNELGRDTVVKLNGAEIPFKYIAVNINYLEKMENGVPVFKRANSLPLEIVTYR